MDKFLKELPAGMADPLHILPPWTSLALTLGFLILLLVMLLWALVYYLTNRPQATDKLPSEPARPYQGSAIDAAIDKIRLTHSELENYREGCHVLSAVIKTHIEKLTGLDVEEMSPSEIGANLKGNVGNFFSDLSILQFGRKEPTKNQFFSICDDSKKIAKARHGVRRT